jgi:hypothetical protein
MAQSPQPNRLRSKLSVNLMLDRVEHNLATVGNGIRTQEHQKCPFMDRLRHASVTYVPGNVLHISMQWSH